MQTTINFNEKLSDDVKDKIFYAIDKAANGITLNDLNVYGKTVEEYMQVIDIQFNQKVLSFIIYFLRKNKRFVLSDNQIASYLNKIGSYDVNKETGEVFLSHTCYKAKTINAAIQTIHNQGLITIEHSPYKKTDMMNPNGWMRREIKINVKEVIKLLLTINFNEMYKPKSFKKTAVKKRLWDVTTNKLPRTIAQLWKLIMSVHKANYKSYIEALSAQDNDFCNKYLKHESRYFINGVETSIEELNKRSIENLINNSKIQDRQLDPENKKILDDIYNLL